MSDAPKHIWEEAEFWHQWSEEDDGTTVRVWKNGVLVREFPSEVIDETEAALDE